MAPLQYAGPGGFVPFTAYRPQSTAYQLFMLFLCLVTLTGVAIQVVFRPPPEVRGVLQMADTAACALFFVDFLVTLRRAPDRWRYMYTWGWLDLLSSIPVFDAARWGRAARLARLLRLLRGVKASVVLTDVVLMHRRQSAFLAAALTLLLMLVSSSVLILTVEDTAQSNIRTAEDALWWATTTLTTVGYGDRYPVTTEGRVIAAGLMAAGVGLVGVLSGLLASWFMEPVRTAEQRQEDLGELRALRQEIQQLRERLDGPRDQASSS
jgi:voltage-gated potassium channel